LCIRDRATIDAVTALGKISLTRDGIIDELVVQTGLLQDEKNRSLENAAALREKRQNDWKAYCKEFKENMIAVLAAYIYEQQLAEYENSLQGKGRFLADEIRDALGEDEYRKYLEDGLATEQWALRATEHLASVLPGTGVLLDGVKAFTGKNLLGEEVGTGARLFAAGMVILAMVGAHGSLGDDVGDAAQAGGRHSQAAKRAADAADEAGDVASSAGKAARSAADELAAAAKSGKNASNSGLQLSPRAKSFYDKGKFSQALDAHYEDLVGRVVKGSVGQEFTHAGKIFEIDVVTADKLIQVKRSLGAADRANFFSGKAFKNQLRATLAIAKREGKTVEYWFKYGVHPSVRAYLEGKGVIVKIGLGI
jgi:hypothetical protein